MTLAQRIQSLLEPDLNSGCHLWPLAVTGGHRGGYGLVRDGGKLVRVHRAVCVEVHGPPPFPDAITLHRCDTRACANGAHLRWGTHGENLQDSWARSRRA